MESIVSVDDRGQMVLPKDVRELLGIRAGEKLALVVMRKEGRPCCIHLFKADELADRVKSLVGPLMEEARRA